MIQFPKSTAFGRRVPKEMFYKSLDVKPEIKRLFVEQIKRITWANKLSPETMNLAPGKNVQEIEVFHIQLTDNELDDRVVTLMDQGIPYHLLFILERPDGKQRLSIAYKEQTTKKDAAFQLRECYHTPWMAKEDLSLSFTALNMDVLYESFVRQIAGDVLQAQNNESLQESVERKQEQEKLQKQIAKLRGQMKREKRLAKQMELRREIVRLEEKYGTDRQ